MRLEFYMRDGDIGMRVVDTNFPGAGVLIDVHPVDASKVRELIMKSHTKEIDLAVHMSMSVYNFLEGKGIDVIG